MLLYLVGISPVPRPFVLTASDNYLWVNGDAAPDIFTASKIAELFDVSIDYLTGVTDTANRNVDVRAVCDSTGLHEESLSNLISIFKHTDIRGNLDFDRWIYNDLSDTLNKFLQKLSKPLIKNVKTFVNTRLKKMIFKKQAIKKYCIDNNIGISNSEIDKNGIYCFRVKFGEREGLIMEQAFEKEFLLTYDDVAYADEDLHLDLDMFEFRIMKEFRNLINDIYEDKLHVDTVFNDEYSDYYMELLSLESYPFGVEDVKSKHIKKYYNKEE